MAQITVDIRSLAFIIAVIGLAWSAFLALQRKGNQSANRYLALLIGVLTIFVLRRSASLEDEGLLLYLYFSSHSLVFLIGPSIYLHIRTLTQQLSLSPIRHFIPFVIMLLLTSALYVLRADIIQIQDTYWLKIAALTLIGIEVTHIIFYLFLTRKRIGDYEKTSKLHQSFTPRINLIWSRKIMLVTSVLGLGILALSLLIITGGYYEINNTADTLFLVTLIFIIASLVTQSWNNPEVIYGNFDAPDKYKQSPLSNPDIDQLKSALEQAIDQNIYLKPDLTLQELAQTIESKPYLLSQVINDGYQQNFFNYINQHRISYAKQQIQQGFLETQTVEALAYAAGFNSKSTFNRAFRKQGGQSPKEFLKALK